MVAATFTYDAEILEALRGHGLDPRPTTSPGFVRAALDDLYRYEIRRLRADLLAGRIVKTDYAGHVVGLRRRYWLLSVPLQRWTAGPHT